MARKPKPEKEGSRQNYATAWDHFKQAATHAGRGAARDTADAYAYAKPRVKAATQKAGEHIRNWYDSLSHDERYNAWRKHGIFPTSRASIKKVAGLNGIDATDDAQILYELECKAYGAPRVGSMSEIGKPSAKFEFETEPARKEFTDELQKIHWDYNVKMTTGGTGGKPKKKGLDKTIFDDVGKIGKPWARFDFRTNDEMREFTEKIQRLNWGDSPPRFDFDSPRAPQTAPSFFPTDGGARTSDVWLLPVSGVKTDTARFQNRKSEFSEASVERIVNDFDENKLDPIVVWRDPEDQRVYVLSGHSRLEAHKRLGRDKIKARFFEGTESEAIRFAKVDANRAATAETVVEDIEAFRLDRDGSAHVAPLKKGEIKKKWKDKANKLEFYSHLSPQGQFIKALSQPDLSQWPGIVNKAMWAGELRAMYPHLTDAHEDELFNYMFKTGGSVEKMLNMTKADLFDRVNDRANAIRYDTDEPLALSKNITTSYAARADTGPALARLRDIRKRLAQIDELSKATESKTARAEMANEKATLMREAEFIDKDIEFLKSSQNALFGIR